MKIKETIQKFNPFHVNYDLPLLQKAASGMGVNLFDQAYYRYLNKDMPVYLEDRLTNYIAKGYSINADIFSLTNYRANLTQMVPWKLYRKKGTDKWDIIQEHPLLDIVNKLDKYAISTYLDTVGNAYIYAPWLESGANKGKTTDLNVLKADIVDIVSGGAMMPVQGYKYNIDIDNPKGIPKEEVLHLKRFNPGTGAGSDLYGMSPLKAAARQIALSNSGTDSMNAAYMNQGVKSIVYSKDNENVQWTPEQAKNLDTTWRQKNGIGRTGSVVFHSKELGKIDLGLSPVDLDTLAGMLHNFRQLCNVFDGFPSQLLNDHVSSTYNNLDSAEKRVYTNCILPRLERLRDELNAWLTPRYGEDLYLDIDISNIAVLQEDKGEQAAWLDKAWWVKGIDKQKMLGTPEDPALDMYFIPANLMPVKDLADLTRPTDIEEEVKRLKGLEINDYKA